MIKKIPITLIYSRLIIGIYILISSFFNFPYFGITAAILLFVGLLTDIFDGIIARKLNVSSEKLRRMDSNIDQVFYSCVVIATFIHCPEFFKTNWMKIGILIGVEALAYLICYLKFKKEIAFHSYGAKLWSIFLFILLAQILLSCQSHIIFDITLYLGIITRLEIIAIVLILKKWVNDVPTFYHAIQLKDGKTIKRSKLFNG